MRAASEVGQAEEQLAAAVAAVERLRGQQVPTAAAAAAGDALAEARAALAAHLASSGAVLPRGEVLFIPRLPAVVAALGADVGEPAPTDGPLLTVFSGEAMVQATASTGQRALLRVGLPATVRVSSGDEIAGRVAAVGEEPVVGDGVHGYHVVIETSRPLPPEAVGSALDVTIDVHATARPVLAVPVTALSTRADGVVTVLRPSPGAATSYEVVPVRVGVSAGGFVEVEALGATLRAGDRVVVSQ